MMRKNKTPNKRHSQRMLVAKRTPKTIFVSYYFSFGNGKPWSYGNTTQFTTSNGRITSEELRTIERILKEDIKATSVVVLNYQIM